MKSIPLTCPYHHTSSLLRVDGEHLCSVNSCTHSQIENSFKSIDGKPILISESLCDTVCESKKITSYVSRDSLSFGWARSLLLRESKVTKINCDEFVGLVKAASSSPKILVIGAGQAGDGTSLLWNDPAIEIHGVDIYSSPTVDIVCDAHYLPLKDGYYDGVWIQAVLEHVVEPSKVVDEIFRVLKIGGLVYAETPFMQQVHEGAYDFTRYSVTGHRYLFRNFLMLHIGGNNGPEIVLSWAIRYFIWSITRSRLLGRIGGLISSIILKPFAILISKESMFDGPSGVFFLGQKKTDSPINLSHKDLINLYRGQF